MTAIAAPLLARLDQALGLSASNQSLMAPLDDPAAFDLVARDALRWLGQQPSARSFVDPASHGRLNLPEDGHDGGQLLAATAHDATRLHKNEWVVAVQSEDVSFFCVGSEDARGDFRGAWSTHPVLLQRLLAFVAGDAVAQLSEDEGLATGPLAATLRFAALLGGHHSTHRNHIARDKADLASVLHILKAISSRRRAHDILFVFVEQIARVVPSDRCSIVRVYGHDDKGHVLASHEDESVTNRTIDLEKYPELRYALRHQCRVLIDDVSSNPLTAPVEDELRKAGMHGLLVIPIPATDPGTASLFLRAARQDTAFSSEEVSFLEIVAEAAANALERAQLFDSIQRANEQLELLAITDDLTGLYNSRFFRQRLGEEQARAERYSMPLACLMFDIDDFKKINDTYGHIFGDRVLQAIAARTAETVRRSDTVGRYGGEEFIVIMPQTSREGALAQAERLLASINAAPCGYDGHEVDVTVSIGVSVYEPQPGDKAPDLIRQADRALYIAKNTGKNRVITAWDQST